jgi:transcription initiation factor TFIID subunit 2
MKAVTEALIPAGDVFHFGFSSADEEIKSAALAELERLLRMDRWIPSFQQTVTQAVLTAKEHLHAKSLDNLPLADLLLYTREGVFDDLRAQAFDTLLRVGGLRRDPAVRYIFFTLANDPSPFMRWRVLRGLCEGLGRMALTGNVPALKVGGNEMVVEEDAAETTAVRKDLMERASIAGAIQALRKELAENQTLKEEMWKCAKYRPPLWLWRLMTVPRRWISRFVNRFWIFVGFCMKKRLRTWSFYDCPNRGNGWCVIASAR